MLRSAAVLVMLTLAGGGWLLARSQQPAISSQMRHATGQAVVPIYEGWFEDRDGRVHATFGYVNLNSEEALDIPIGANNVIAPGPADQNQPTHFQPGHRKGVFTVALPRDRSDTEITWTLSIRGQTMSVPSNLGQLYQIEGLVTNGGPFPGNTPPVMRFEPRGASGQGPGGLMSATPFTTSAQTGATVDLWVTDDGLPGEVDPLVVRSLQSGLRRRQRRQMSVTWSKYRGPGEVHFSDSSPPIEQGRASTTVTFSEPGDYMLRVVASDGSGFNGCCWTNAYVRATAQ